MTAQDGQDQGTVAVGDDLQSGWLLPHPEMFQQIGIR
jgi:hypothetical protein